MQIYLDPIAPDPISRGQLRKAWQLVVRPWDGSKETFEQYVATVEGFMRRNRRVMSNKDGIDLIKQSVPAGDFPDTKKQCMYLVSDVLEEMRDNCIPKEALAARQEFRLLKPRGIVPFDADLTRQSLGQHHHLFFKSLLPDYEGYSRLQQFLPVSVAKDITKRLWDHKNRITYNFVRDLALNLLKNEPQERLKSNSSTVGCQPRSQFTLLPHNPPYFALEIPPQKPGEADSCYENRKRQLIESRERRGMCGYCTSKEHGYFECPQRTEVSPSATKRSMAGDCFEPQELPPAKKSKIITT